MILRSDKSVNWRLLSFVTSLAILMSALEATELEFDDSGLINTGD